jgi:hypothetical protein
MCFFIFKDLIEKEMDKCQNGVYNLVGQCVFIRLLIGYLVFKIEIKVMSK